MFQLILSGGPFMVLLFLLALAIIFISLKNIKESYFTNGIILLGVCSALIGIMATYLGVSSALNLMPNISNISPQILFNGLKTSLVTSYTGGIIMFFSTGLWYFFIKKYSLT